MPATTPANTAGTLTALASADAPLPAAALDALAGYAMRDPALRVPLRIALLKRPEMTADLAATVASGPGSRVGVLVVYLLRPEHDRATLRAALSGHDGDGLRRLLAAAPAASPMLLEVIADLGDADAMLSVLRHRSATDSARLTALLRLDGYAGDLVLLDDDNAWYEEFTTAVSEGVHGQIAATAALTLTNPILLATVLLANPLPDDVHRRALDICLDAPLRIGPLRLLMKSSCAERDSHDSTTTRLSPSPAA